MKMFIAASALALGGCDDATSSETPVAITGTRQLIHWDEAGGSAPSAEAPRALFVEAELANGEVRAARVADDDTFVIDAVPSGPYWLRLVDDRLAREDVYLLTDAATIDLGFDVVGDEAGRAASPNTQVVVDAAGLAPWQDGDDGDFVVADLGYRSSFATFFAANVPVAGDTALRGLTYGWQTQPISAQAAAAMFVQLRHVHDDALGMDYLAPVTSFRSDPIAIAEAATARIAGTFTAAPSLDVPVRWTRSAFVAEAAAMQPAGCAHDLDFETYWVHALPGGGAHGELARTFFDRLAGVPENGPRVVGDVFVEGDGDLDGILHVGSPYPRDWLYARYAMSFIVGCPVPGGRSPGNAEAEIGVVTNDLDTAVAPLVGPAREPQIDGRALTTPQLGVGHAPSISWTAPASGTATSYELHLSEVVPGGGPLGPGVSLHEDAVLIVPGDVTTITLPRDVLADGTLYTLRIRAVSRAGQATATAPFRAAMPLGYADLYTSYFQP